MLDRTRTSHLARLELASPPEAINHQGRAAPILLDQIGCNLRHPQFTDHHICAVGSVAATATVLSNHHEQ
jgi:hypothetical protein